MAEIFAQQFMMTLNIISFVILGALLLSKHRHRITLVSFWQNVVLLFLLLFASKVAGLFGHNYFSELIFLIFSFLVMLIMIISFVFHYPVELSFEGKKRGA